MRRDEKVTAGRPDPIREAVGLPVGVEGQYFVSAGGMFGQEGFDTLALTKGVDLDTNQRQLGIIDDNSPPSGQPDLWLKWEPNEDGTAIRWSGAEKFYHYKEWLAYLIDHFLKPWGYKLNGKVEWQGERESDKGFIYIDNNRVYVNETPTVLDLIVKATNEPQK